MQTAEWMEQIDRDYLNTFVKQGGAAVKFFVGDAELRADVRSRLAALAEQRGYLVLSADAAEHRFHMPQDIFFAIARQVDWRLTARRFLVKLAAREGFKTEQVDAAAGDVLQAVRRPQRRHQGLRRHERDSPHAARDFLRREHGQGLPRCHDASVPARTPHGVRAGVRGKADRRLAHRRKHPPRQRQAVLDFQSDQPLHGAPPAALRLLLVSPGRLRRYRAGTGQTAGLRNASAPATVRVTTPGR